MRAEAIQPIDSRLCLKLVPDSFRVAALSAWRLNTRLHAGSLLSIVNTVSEVPERWSKACVYPDMWTEPDEDPRNTDGVSPDVSWRRCRTT